MAPGTSIPGQNPGQLTVPKRQQLSFSRRQLIASGWLHVHLLPYKYAKDSIWKSIPWPSLAGCNCRGQLLHGLFRWSPCKAHWAEESWEQRGRNEVGLPILLMRRDKRVSYTMDNISARGRPEVSPPGRFKLHGESNDINAALEIPCARQSDTKLVFRDVRGECKLVMHLYPMIGCFL